MVKMYLASRYSRREELAEIAKALRNEGHTVTARWLKGTHRKVEGEDPAGHNARFAVEDIEDIREAQLLVLFTDMLDSGLGGKDVEFGYALAIGKKIALVGPLRNVFHFLPEVKHFECVEDFIGWARR